MCSCKKNKTPGKINSKLGIEMDYFIGFEYLTDILVWIAIIFCFGIYALKKKEKYNLPPGPRGLPLIGILPFLGDNPHLDMIKFSKKYGDIFGVYMGRSYVVVVTDIAITKELLSKKSTANRPPGFFQFFPGGVGFEEQNGKEWVEQRRYTMMEMKNLGFGRSHWEKLVKMEVSEFLDLLEQSQGKPIDIHDPLSASVSNNILSLVTNRKLPFGNPKANIIVNGIKSVESLYNPSGFMIYFPKLFKLAFNIGLLRIKQKMKDIMLMSQCIRQEIEEIKQDKEGHSFIHKYLAEIEKNEQLNLGNHFNDDNLFGNVQALITAGNSTIKVSLLWLFLAMASFPEIQAKVHEELDREIGKHNTVDWVDRQKLSYCLATIMEGQRWRSLVPLNLLHRANEDLNVKGYDIPKGTDILVVFWAFHHNDDYWKNPDIFQPDRFLSNSQKIDKDPEYFLPFSYGKRACPGKTVGLIELFHYFVTTMQRFRVLPVSDIPPELIGVAGLTLEPKRQTLRFVIR